MPGGNNNKNRLFIFRSCTDCNILLLQIYTFLYRIIGISLINFLMGQITGACSLFFTENYNGKRGINLKYVFYCFYPVSSAYIVRHIVLELMCLRGAFFGKKVDITFYNLMTGIFRKEN